MKEILVDRIAWLFFGILISVITMYIKRKLLDENDKKHHDEALAEKVLSYFDVYDMNNQVLFTIEQGFLSSDNKENIDKLLYIEMDTKKFYDKKTQLLFISYLKTFKKFQDYFVDNWYYDAQSKKFWINKYQRQQDDLTSQQRDEVHKRFEESKVLMEEVKLRLLNFEENCRKRFPLLFRRMIKKGG